jgi:hypothetical protein
MIPKRLERYVDRIIEQPDDVIEKKARGLQYFTWFWLFLLVVMAVEFVTGVVSTKKFVLNELLIKTMPFFTMAAIMAHVRDTQLCILIMKKRNSATPGGDGKPETQT